MAGKRLIDAAKLFNAGSNVAKQHFTLRRQQLDVYSKTSTLAKAVKSQTDRVTVTAAAAIELAKRFNETGPAWQQQQQNEQRERQYSAGPEDVDGGVQTVNTTVEATREHELRSGQEHDLSSQRKRELQRQAEAQIPSQTADAQPSIERVGGEDTFNERPESSSPELSSLPRSKLPKHAEEQPMTSQPEEAFPEPEADQKLEPQDVPQSLNPDVFSSPRVSRMLGQAGGDMKNPYAGRQKAAPKPLPEMVAAQERWQRERAGAAPPTGDAETQDLAAAIAQGAEVCRPHAPLPAAAY